MNNFIFQNPTQVYFGKGCTKEYLVKELAAFGKNVLLAYGGGSIKENGIYNEITRLLEDAGKQVFEFSGIMPNPTYQKVLEGAQLAKKNQIDLILAVGGGSVTDCSKAIAMAAVSTKDIWENFWARPGVVSFSPLPVGVIVTTIGSGSEMNGGAIITNERIRVKTGRDYAECTPRFALLDPTYTYSIPKAKLVSGGFDILSHIMESYFSGPDDDNVSDSISEALMKSVIVNLREVIRNLSDYNARSNLMWASSMAENRIIRLGKKSGFLVHQIEHQLGAYTNCNQGSGLAVIHPVLYRYVYGYCTKKYARFASEVWGISRAGKTENELALAGVEALAGFIKELGLPTTLTEIGITDVSVLKAVAESCNISSGSGKRLNRAEIFDILKECV